MQAQSRGQKQKKQKLVLLFNNSISMVSDKQCRPWASEVGINLFAQACLSEYVEYAGYFTGAFSFCP